MALPRSRTRRSRLELDWVIVSIEGVRRWGLFVFFVVLAAAAVGVTYYLLHEPIDRRALRTLRRASAEEEQLRRSGVNEGLATEFEQASLLLEQARSDCESKDFAPCLARAGDALHRFDLLAGLAGRDFSGSGQIISLEGKVEVQRANQTRWERARDTQVLYNGDFVKTSTDGSAEVLFRDGTVYRVGSDTLLEMHREASTGTRPTSGEVKLTVGEVNVTTALNQSVVLTDSARAEVDRESRVGVDVREDRGTIVAAYAGQATVTGKRGESTTLVTRQAVSADVEGGLGNRRVIPAVPVLTEPPANVVLNLDASDRVKLRWGSVVGASGYDLELSRTRVFTEANLEVASRNRRENEATIRVLRPGTYYWRVDAVAADQIRSEWSTPRALRAATGKRVEELVDTTPPKLDVAKPTQIGNLFLIQGRTEPGASVTINGEPVDVGADGNFKKAIALHQVGASTIVIRSTDPAGNTTEHLEPVYLEAE
jgi:Glucodextranase, domain B/FecR protein